MSIAVLHGGTRDNGNTETLTGYITEGLQVENIYLKDFTIKPIVDLRHSKEGFQNRDDDYNHIIDRILPHDILLFSTPIYWYSMSGTMKTFIDRWSQTLRDPNYPDFKSIITTKKAYVVAVGGDRPQVKGLPMIQQFQYIFDFIGIDFAGYILGTGNKPGDIQQDKHAIASAKQLRETLKIII